MDSTQPIGSFNSPPVRCLGGCDILAYTLFLPSLRAAAGLRLRCQIDTVSSGSLASFPAVLLALPGPRPAGTRPNLLLCLYLYPPLRNLAERWVCPD